MINILDFSETRFTLDGVEYLKNYISRISEDRITIFNCYDNRDILLPWTSYDEVNLNGLIYSSAQELHAEILDVIYLRTTLGNSQSFVQNNVGIEFLVGELPGEGNITVSEAVTALNALSWSIVVSRVRTPVIISFTRSQKKYMFIFLKGYGIWGSANGSNPDYPISANDLIALPALNLTNDDIQSQNGTVIIDLGNLPTGNYLTAANSASRNFSNAGTLNEDGYPITYYFSYTQDGVLYFVQFVGTPAVYNGNLQASDLVSTTNSTVVPGIDFQGVMNNGSEAIVNTPITFIYDNGSVNVKIALNEDGAFITTNDNTIQIKPDAVAVSSTVSGSDAVEDNEFVTKQQLDGAVGNQTLQETLENGSTATIPGGFSITTDDGSDVSNISSGPDGFGFQHNTAFLNIQEGENGPLVSTNGPIELEPAVENNQAVTRRQLFAEITTTSAFIYPAEFLWRPFVIFKKGTEYMTSLVIDCLVDHKIAKLQPFYVDYNAGLNTNDGSESAPFKTVEYAFSQGAKLVYIPSGLHRSGIMGSISNSSYGSDDKFILAKDRDKPTYIAHDAEGLVWNTYNSIYSADISASNTTQQIYTVVDFTYTNQFGLPQRLEAKESIAEVESTTGTFYVDAVNDVLYVNTLDTRLPDNDIVCLTSYLSKAMRLSSTEYLYMKGIRFMGGNTGFSLTTVSNPATPNGLISECMALYSEGNGFRVQNTGGVIWSHKCVSYDNGQDGFNYTQNAAVTSQRFIETYCSSFLNGFKSPDGTSKYNGSSAHNNITGIRIGGCYWGNKGPDVIDVSGAKSLNIGLYAFDNRGESDVAANPANAGVNWADWGSFAAGTYDGANPTKMWFYDCQSGDERRSFHTPEFLTDGVTPDDSVIYIKDCSYIVAPEGNINTDDWLEEDVDAFEFPPLSGFTEYTVPLATEEYVDNNAPQIKNNDLTDSVPLTGTTVQTILKVSEPMTLSDGILSIASFFDAGNVDNIDYRVDLNHAGDLSGSPLSLGKYVLNRNFVNMTRDVLLRGGNVYGMNAANSSQNTFPQNTAPLNTAFDYTTPFHVIISALLTNTSDTCVCNSLLVEFKKS